MQTITKLLRITVISASLVIVAGCASNINVTGAWEPAADKRKQYSRVLVVTLAGDSTGRQQFNTALLSNIRSAGGEAWSAQTLAGNDAIVTRELVEEMVADNNADAVLVTRVVKQKVRAKEITEQTDSASMRSTGSQYSGDYGTFGSDSTFNFVQYDYKPEIEADDYIVAEYKIELSSSVYDVSKGEVPVYTITSKAEKQTDTSKMITSIAKSVADRLRSAGLIGK